MGLDLWKHATLFFSLPQEVEVYCDWMKSFMRKKGDGSLESVLKKIEDAQVTMDF